MKTKILINSMSVGLAFMFLSTSCTTTSGTLNTNSLLSAGAKLAQASTISNSQIQSLVSQSVAEMDAQNTLLPASNPYSQRLARIVQGITQVDGTPLNFAVYQTNDVNAFACADGSVRVYTGLMDLMDDNEVLGVIGHEVGHVGLEHSKKAYQTALVNSAILDGIGSLGNIGAALSTSQLLQLGEQAANAKYSRKEENEADEYGYQFLKQAGKNPWAMVHAFEKLQSLEGSTGTQASYVTKMFSSHPETESRINAMKKMCKKDGISDYTTTTTSSTTTSKTTTTSSAKTNSSAKSVVPKNSKSVSADDLFKK